ncbi:ABC transporter substrate-binding protein [Amycolatopsis endophytica]|uniref:Osmoprotectant transport system substrate-binding protein n=1 Tax=Amycolatopsis endophytica TaxID=860233 RepID=A0A853AZ60_9PSEU|nr:ABC transporter substrate-binding protein [Amycolatopsis endophytica]NYI88048.1 osmoprotectant transport system substrate-binding protein [Amycolatopsis endophytica]
MRWTRSLRAAGVLAVAVLGLTACGGGDDGGSAAPSKGGAPIVVASFNFTDSQILSEVYSQALEAQGYPVERKFNIGSRELVYPSLKSGELQFIPEYQGAAISSGFNEQAPTDAASEHAKLAELFQASGVGLLDYAPAENKNTYVVKSDLAQQQGLKTISDLKKLDKVVLGGPPECGTRANCFVGFRDVYKLNVTFSSIQESGPRVEQLRSGAVTVIPLDSVNPLVGTPDFTALEDDQKIVATENIVPAVNQKVLDERGADFAAAVNAVSAKLTTDQLRELNKQVDEDGDQVADVAKDWLSQQGLI